MSCRQNGYPWPSLATSPYHSSPPAGLLGYIPCPHIAAVCKFGPVVLLLLIITCILRFNDIIMNSYDNALHKLLLKLCKPTYKIVHLEYHTRYIISFSVFI